MGKKQESSIYKMLLVSIVSIILLIVVFSGASYAWFSSSIASSSNTIETASYSLDVKVTFESTDVPVVSNKYSLDASKEYNVTLTTTGNAETGFCIVKVYYSDSSKDAKLYTCQIAKDGTITFVLSTTENVEVEFIACWGTSSKYLAPDISDGVTKEI